MLEEFINKQNTPMGIGIDCVSISGLKALNERTNGSFVKGAFTENEIKLSQLSQDKWSFLAGRFAVKEAVFKALAHLTADKSFDFRRVETLSNPDGSPYIVLSSVPGNIWEQANASKLLVSITNEDDYAIAFVMAC